MSLENIFKYHVPSIEQIEKYDKLRAKAKEFAQLICDVCPENEDSKNAINMLRNAIMWANASIAIGECKAVLH